LTLLELDSGDLWKDENNEGEEDREKEGREKDGKEEEEITAKGAPGRLCDVAISACA
jgi:hypothetical protein